MTILCYKFVFVLISVVYFSILTISHDPENHNYTKNWRINHFSFFSVLWLAGSELCLKLADVSGSLSKKAVYIQAKIYRRPPFQSYDTPSVPPPPSPPDDASWSPWTPWSHDQPGSHVTSRSHERWLKNVYECSHFQTSTLIGPAFNTLWLANHYKPTYPG